MGKDEADGKVGQVIHFAFNPGESTTLRCRLLGHEWKMASASLDGAHFDTLIVNVCARCHNLQNRSWDELGSLKVDGGESALETLKYRSPSEIADIEKVQNNGN